jgi:hypothetical protein
MNREQPIRIGGNIIGYRRKYKGQWTARYEDGTDLGKHPSEHLASLAIINQYEALGAPYDEPRRTAE